MPPRSVQVYNPLGWTSTDWTMLDGQGSALPAGVTIVSGGADPVHPFAGALGEQILKLAAGSAATVGGASGGGTATPDAAHRWAMLLSILCWLPALPAAEATLLSAATNPFRLTVRPDGTLALYVGTGLPLAGTSTAVMPTGAWRQLEVWCAYRDSAGNLLSTKQWVVRLSGAVVAGVPPAWTTMINVSAEPAQVLYAGGFNATIGTGQGVYGPAMYAASAWGGWEDADHPFGWRRIDAMRPSTVKGVGTPNEWPGNCANVDDLLPDGDVTHDSVQMGGGITSKTQLYRLTDPAYITAADLLTGTVEYAGQLYITTGSKSIVNDITPTVSDGVTSYGLASVATGSYQEPIRLREGTIGNAIPWTRADLLSLQAGAHASTNDPTLNNVLAKMSAVIILVPYQAAAETGTALPPPPSAGGGSQAILI